jgi:hypothetical protein
MQLRLDRTRALVGFAVLGISIVLVAIVVAPRSRGSSLPPAQAPSEGTCTDLAREVDPAQVPVDSGYDPEKDLIYAHYNGRTYVMKPDDPVCRSFASTRALIDDTMNANKENVAVACNTMKDLVANKRTEFRGHAVDLAAAQRFITRRCATSQP